MRDASSNKTPMTINISGYSFLDQKSNSLTSFAYLGTAFNKSPSIRLQLRHLLSFIDKAFPAFFAAGHYKHQLLAPLAETEIIFKANNYFNLLSLELIRLKPDLFKTPGYKQYETEFRNIVGFLYYSLPTFFTYFVTNSIEDNEIESDAEQQLIILDYDGELKETNQKIDYLLIPEKIAKWFNKKRHHLPDIAAVPFPETKEAKQRFLGDLRRVFCGNVTGALSNNGSLKHPWLHTMLSEFDLIDEYQQIDFDNNQFYQWLNTFYRSISFLK